MTGRGSVRSRGIPLSSLGLDIEPAWHEVTDAQEARADYLADRGIDPHAHLLDLLSPEPSLRICGRCECPLPPYVATSGWPYKPNDQCTCPDPEPLTVAPEARWRFEETS